MLDLLPEISLQSYSHEFGTSYFFVANTIYWVQIVANMVLLTELLCLVLVHFRL